MQLLLKDGRIEPQRPSEADLYRERFYDVVHAIKQLRGQTKRRDLPGLHGRETTVKFEDCSEKFRHWHFADSPRVCLRGMEYLL